MKKDDFHLPDNAPDSHHLLGVLFAGWDKLDKGAHAPSFFEFYASHLVEQINKLSDPPSARLVATCLSDMGRAGAVSQLPENSTALEDILAAFNAKHRIWDFPDAVVIWRLAARAASSKWNNPRLLKGLLELEGAPATASLATRSISLATTNRPPRSPYESENRTLLGWACAQPPNNPGMERTACLQYLLGLGISPDVRATIHGASALALASAPQARLLLDAGLELFPKKTHQPSPFSQWIDPVRLEKDPDGVTGLVEELARQYARLGEEEKERFSRAMSRRLARQLAPIERWQLIPRISDILKPLGEAGMDISAWRIDWAKALLFSNQALGFGETWAKVGSRNDMVFFRKDGVDTPILPRTPWTNAIALAFEPSPGIPLSKGEAVDLVGLLPDLPPAWPRMAIACAVQDQVDADQHAAALFEAEKAVLQARTCPDHPFHKEASSILARKSRAVESTVLRHARLVASMPDRLAGLPEKKREELRTHLAFLAGGSRTIDIALDWMQRWANATAQKGPDKGPLDAVVVQAFESPVVAGLLAENPARQALWESIRMDAELPAPSAPRAPGRSRF